MKPAKQHLEFALTIKKGKKIPIEFANSLNKKKIKQKEILCAL